MECAICSAVFPSHGQPTCISCARSLVYQARLDRLADLLNIESLSKQVHSVISPLSGFSSSCSPSNSQVVDITESAKKHVHAHILRESQATHLRCTIINEQINLLRKQMEQARRDNALRHLDIKQRHAEIKRERTEMTSRVPQLLEPLHATIRRSQRRLDKVQARTLEGRTKLCQETARLAGLQQKRRRMPDGSIVHDYAIGGISILDLRQINSAQPQLINAALANICRLLITCCHYLSVRLPAEITPPHASYPHPTIFSLQSSYQGFQLPFPGSSSTPASSRTLDQRPLPKPRLLHLDRPLVALAKEDPARYNLYIEGISLLAWNVAWLCTSQGLNLSSAYQAVCPMGLNLYTLFREHTGRGPTPHQTSAGHPAGTNQLFGQFSHASTRQTPGPTDGVDVMHNWRAASFTRFLDKIKQILFQDMSGAEWEMISGDDFEQEEAVLVGGSRGARAATAIGSSSMKRVVESEDAFGDDGNKGYLKLKSRTGGSDRS
ncbi:hypothetical protein M436DRAFT_38292 [Aureobasidium namibiae CBS 147.97]|uniref:Autophagy-related protein 14 n=1 Tax=Aureobasidium namibiae CBS 147.97 TaxID=1043004 RepID=A0A074XRH8_9PEZI|nr:uncharacterized protein M436DRAFT_38292 [Aureobasidium namibiae CBS 147.97]KEQ77156.1 hypothetical protein M436DRAFT_38292 [Aureobasidium namibiae CBS 147.97]